LNFEPSGKVIPCCLTSTHNYFAGDLNKQPIEKIWNSDKMKNLRLQMMRGEEPTICSKCFDRERVTGESGRVYHNMTFKNVVDSIPTITEPDGAVPDMKLKYWDFRFSNLCNFKCRSCGPRYSSAWVPDATALDWISNQDKVWTIQAVNQESNFKFLEKQVDFVEKIYFAGGEPLLMDEHWYILNLLVKHKKFNTKVCYNTNFSTLVYKKQNALDLWSQWNDHQLEIWPSIDEIGERAELIRSGTVWSKIDENFHKVKEIKTIFIKPSITVGAFNVFRLPEIIEYFLDIGIINQKYNYSNFFLNLLELPTHYHVQILSDKHKSEIYLKLLKFVYNYNKKYKTNISLLFTHLLHELKKPNNPQETLKFLRMTKQLDTLRNEDTFKTIPELSYINEIQNV
jgi:radical SAM protein with 4Fe4S-binding SPASM domain